MNSYKLITCIVLLSKGIVSIGQTTQVNEKICGAAELKHEFLLMYPELKQQEM